MTNHETRQTVRKGITMKVDYQSEDLATLGQWIFHSTGELDSALNPTDKAPAPNPDPGVSFPLEGLGKRRLAWKNSKSQ